MSDMPIYTSDEITRILDAMRTELTHVNVRELSTPQAVAEAFEQKGGTTLLVVNSVCGCAAGNARPGVALALQNSVIPDHSYTVFAGQDREATQRAREFLPEQPPSSPSIFLFKDGNLVYAMHRHMIEGRTARMVAYDLVRVFNEHCKAKGPSVPPDVFAKSPSVRVCGSTIPTREEMEQMMAGGGY
jgi:putative YphP/YqiW family bacilliredoxin